MATPINPTDSRLTEIEQHVLAGIADRLTGDSVDGDPHRELIERLATMRRELVEQLAGLDHLDGGLVRLLSEVQGAIEAVEAVRSAG